MAKKSKRVPLTQAVTPPTPLPKPEVDLEGLDNLTKNKSGSADKPRVKAPKPKHTPRGAVKGTKAVSKTNSTRKLSVDLDAELFTKFKAWCAINNTRMKSWVAEKIRETVETV
jgi:hypothetical protein